MVGFNGAIVAKDSQGYGVFASFINTYTVSGTDTVSIEIRAQLQDLSGASVAKTPSELTFGLYQADKLLHTFPVTSAAGETYLNLNFGSLNVGKSIEYTVKQILPEAKVSGMQYSEAAYPVTISVYDDTKGGVYALISSDKMSGESVTLEFVNIYDPEDCIWAPEGMVELDGAELSGSEFEFVLCSADESFTKLTEITRSENIGSHISFGDVTFDRVGRYCFVIMQLDLGADGYTYDDTAYEIVVDVTDNNGVLVYDIEETDIRFANSYNKPADNTKPGESQNNTAKPGVQKPATSPQTDDKADFALWYTMLVISGLGFACLVLTSVRRNRR